MKSYRDPSDPGEKDEHFSVAFCRFFPYLPAKVAKWTVVTFKMRTELRDIFGKDRMHPLFTQQELRLIAALRFVNDEPRILRGADLFDVMGARPCETLMNLTTSGGRRNCFGEL